MRGYQYVIMYIWKPTIYYNEIGVYGQARAPTGASYTYYAGSTLGLDGVE